MQEKQDAEDPGPVSVPCCLKLRKKFNQLIENKMCIRSHPHPLTGPLCHFLKKRVLYLALSGLSCLRWDLAPWPGIEPGPPHELSVLGTWRLSCWTTRKVSPLPLHLGIDFSVLCVLVNLSHPSLDLPAAQELPLASLLSTPLLHPGTDCPRRLLLFCCWSPGPVHSGLPPACPRDPL